ncbi:MAG: DUF3667 domain-containing protein [Rudaea sp.]|nr:DUF3667 domain-containing protein [Rudaea sp.]
MSTTPESVPPAGMAPGVADAAAAATFATPKTLCANCSKELLGPYCYSCGQPVKGLIRQLTSILSDILDTVLNVDSRIFRTLFPLYFRPGFLSVEYFAGRRVRYVTPFRLYFFLSVAAFLLMQTSLDTLDLSQTVHFDIGDSISSALTREEVAARRDAALAELTAVKTSVGMPAPATKEMEKAAEKIRTRADQRLAYLQSVDEAKAKGAAAPPDPDAERHGISFGGQRWDAKTNPVRIGWLPDFVNAKLNALAGRMVENADRIRKDPKPFLIGACTALPQVLFVLMPLFALLLKIFYIFKRRLYMEHLIVALHSHSFIFLSLLLLTLASLAQGWAHDAAHWLYYPLGWVIFAMGWWLPIYLFLMQKKVYRQGWVLTTLKYGMIGICYTVMITLGVSVAFLVSLATT